MGPGPKAQGLWALGPRIRVQGISARGCTNCKIPAGPGTFSILPWAHRSWTHRPWALGSWAWAMGMGPRPMGLGLHTYFVVVWSREYFAFAPISIPVFCTTSILHFPIELNALEPSGPRPMGPWTHGHMAQVSGPICLRLRAYQLMGPGLDFSCPLCFSKTCQVGTHLFHSVLDVPVNREAPNRQNHVVAYALV